MQAASFKSLTSTSISRIVRRDVRMAASQPSMRNFDSQNGAGPVQPPQSSATEAKTYRVSLFDAMKFNGPAPEKINARLAMVGLLLAADREMKTGEVLLEQIQHPDWRVVIAMLLIMQGTMVQVLKGAKDEDFGFMSVLAEKVNGRLAMLGFAGLATLEWYSNVPFF